MSQRSAVAGGIVRSRRTAESAKDPRRLAELCGRGGRQKQPRIRGGWRNCAFAADGGISERFVAAGGNHLCARDAPAIGIRRSRRTAESATFIRGRSAAAGGILSSRRTAESATDSLRLAEIISAPEMPHLYLHFAAWGAS